jgi:MYXO-CTERM domain-containing protein
VPTLIAFYPLAPWAIADEAAFQASPLHLRNSWMWGRSPSDYESSDTTLDMALGRNRLDGWMSDRTEGASTNDVTIAKRDASGGANFVPSEAYLQVYDSGGPMFVLDENGDLVLAGINWSINEGGVRNSVFSYTGSYAAEIQDFIDAHPVPEPGGAGIVALAMALAALGRRRKIFQ